MYPEAHWRVVRTRPLVGAMNMAIDEAILNAVAEGRSRPTLRFFAWEPACLSLGYGQPWAEVDAERLAARGWTAVRRPTGGRAILHTDELTYSVIAPMDEPRVVGSIVDSYRQLSAGLTAGVQRLGLLARSEKNAKPGDGDREVLPVCFEVPSDYEITADGRKLIGSAQVRKRGVVLQHGTLPLTGDIARIVEALVFADEQARAQVRARVHQRAATLADVGLDVSWAQAADALQAGFADALTLSLTPADLSPDEWAAAEQLCAEKYGAESFLQRV
jgi:lipoate-protein ligase A